MVKANTTRYKLILENSKAIFTGVAQTVKDAILIIDRSGEILFINKSFESLTGYASEEVIGTNFKNLLPEDTRGNHSKLNINPNNQAKHISQGRFINHDGIEKSYCLTFKAIRVWNRHIISIILNNTIEPSPANLEMVEAYAAMRQQLEEKEHLLQEENTKNSVLTNNLENAEQKQRELSESNLKQTNHITQLEKQAAASAVKGQEIIDNLQKRISALQQEISLLQANLGKTDDELSLSRQGQSALKMTNQLYQTRLGELEQETTTLKESLSYQTNRCWQLEKTIQDLGEQLKTNATQHQDELGKISTAALVDHQKALDERSSLLQTTTELRLKLALLEDQLTNALLDKKQFLEDFHLLIRAAAPINDLSNRDEEDNSG